MGDLLITFLPIGRLTFSFVGYWMYFELRVHADTGGSNDRGPTLGGLST